MTTVRPGETLIVCCPDSTTIDAAAAMREAISARLPGVDVLILMATSVAVYQPVTL